MHVLPTLIYQSEAVHLEDLLQIRDEMISSRFHGPVEGCQMPTGAAVSHENHIPISGQVYCRAHVPFQRKELHRPPTGSLSKFALLSHNLLDTGQTPDLTAATLIAQSYSAQ